MWCPNIFKGIISFNEVAIIIVISSQKWENRPKFKELFQGLGAYRWGGWQSRSGLRALRLWWHPNQDAAHLDQRTLFFCLHHSAVNHWGNQYHHLSFGLSHSTVCTWHLISVLSFHLHMWLWNFILDLQFNYKKICWISREGGSEGGIQR